LLLLVCISVTKQHTAATSAGYL